MKIALTADLHFDLRMRYSHPDTEFITTRMRDHVECFRWIVEEAKSRYCSALYVLGDVFECRTEIDVGVLDIVCREFNRARSLTLPITVLAGNHDCQTRDSTRSSIRALEGIASVVFAPTIIGPCALVPWSDSEETLAGHVSQVAGDKSVEYLFTHCLVRDLYPGGGGVSLETLRPDRFMRIILGDVHTPVDLGNMQYCGAPMHLDYGDAGRDAGFWILDTDDDSLQFVGNASSPRFHVIKHEDSVDVAKPVDIDFVRVEIENPEEAARVTAKVQRKSKWVETNSVETADIPLRVEVHTSDAHADVIRSYCDYKGCADNDERVKLGLAILEQVL
jgi:DNA repair exonuclease SbcCD nuclease subunit